MIWSRFLTEIKLSLGSSRERERERERERALNPDVVLNTLIPIGKSYFDNNKNKIVEAHSDLVMK